MRRTKTKWGVAAAVLAMLLSLTAGLFAWADGLPRAGTSATTAHRVTTSNGLVRAVKVENDSFTVTYQNDCKAVTNWGFAFSDSPDTPLGIGDGGATKNALDFLVQAENFNVYNNNGWSECTAVLHPGEGAGWMLAPYSVNKPTHLTISKAAEDGSIRIACYSEGGNTWATEGSVAGVSDWRNGKTLTFDDLVDENGYTYWRVAPNADYPITITDNRTTVEGIAFENVRDISRVTIVGAKDAAGKSLYVADPQISASGYSYVCEEAVSLQFSDGENTVTANVGENVVFPKMNYSIDNDFTLGGSVMTGSSNRFSVGDSAYGMIDVAESGVKFDLGIELSALPAGNVNFNICIGPNTAVQAPAQTGMPAGVFSIFTTVTGEGKVAVAFYDGNWTQHTGDIEVAVVSVGTRNRFTVEIKKENDVWGLYIAGRKLEGSHGGNTFDFHTAIGASFMNAQHKTNIALVGWSAPQVTVSLLGTKIEVDADVSSVYNADFYAEMDKAYDSLGNEVPVFQSDVTETGYSFVTLRPDEIVKCRFVTRGGVATEVQTNVAEKLYDDEIVLGDNAHDKTVTVVNDSGIRIPDADIAVKEGETDVSRYYEMINHNDGTYTLRGVQKTVTVSISHTENGKPATKEEVIAAGTSSVTVTLEFFSYGYTSELYKTLTGTDRIFTTGKIYAGRGAGISLQLGDGIKGSAGLQLFFSDSPFTADNFEDAGSGPENLNGRRNGIRIIALKSDTYLYLDILTITDGNGSSVSGCDYTGEAGKVRLNLRPCDRHTFSVIGNGLYIDGTCIYEWDDALWLTEDDACYMGMFLSRGYTDDWGNGTLQVYADTVSVQNVSFSGVTDADFAGMRFVGRDSTNHFYELSSLALDTSAQSYVASGFNIGHKIVAIDVYTAGGVKATLSLEPEEVAFGQGHTLTITTNMPIALSDVTVCDSDGNDITRYLKLTASESGLVLRGAENKTFVVTIAKENMNPATVSVTVEEADVQQSVDLVRATYTVTLDLRVGTTALTGMENNITVYAAGNDETPLEVTVTFADGKYLISGMEKGTAVRIVFRADGYTSDSVGATDTTEISMPVSRIYTATFTVKAGESYLTAPDGITVRGANTGVELRHNGTAFVLEGLTQEIRVTVQIDGYAVATQDFDAEHTQADIVLTRGGALDTAALSASVTAAEAALAKVGVSTDGKDVASDKKWVTAEAKATLEAAVAAAQNVMESATTQQQIDEAKAALDAAVEAFEGAAQNGTKQAKKKGCGGSVAASFGGGALLLVLAAVLVGKRRRFVA